MGRKTQVVVHNLTKNNDGSRPGRTSRWLDPVVTELDRSRELELENALLRARVVELKTRLDDLAAERQDLTSFLEADDDASVEAFEAFLSTPDPHLDRVRRFLLD